MIVKIWPIKADYSGQKGKVGGAEGLRNSVNYITDENKVFVRQDDKKEIPIPIEKEDVLENSFINTEQNFKRITDYMCNEDKTSGTYITKYMCGSGDVVTAFRESAAQIQLLTKGKTKNNSGSLAFHIVQSFPEGLNISDEEVHQCGVELVEKLKKHQALICSHLHPVLDEEGEVHGKCKHNHILINAYIDPRFYDKEKGGPGKYNDCNESYRQLQIYNDEIAIEHGFPIISDPDIFKAYSWFESSKSNKGKSWKAQMCRDIDNVRRVSNNWNEFVKYMSQEGYTLSEGKYVTYTSPDGEHKARGKTLGRRYTKASLELYWASRDYDINRIKADLDLNAGLYLSDFVYYYGEKLFAKIPLGAQYVEDRKFYYLPLDHNIKANEEAITSYFKLGERYDICDESGEPVMAATGLELLRTIQDLQDEELMAMRHKKKMEEEEIVEARRRREKERDDYARQQAFYENKNFVNSRTGKSYRIGLYDQNGNKRTQLELAYVLALVVLEREDNLWIPTDIAPEKEQEIFFASTNWKIQNVVDSIELSREEALETPAQLAKRLDIVGADLSRTKKALRRTTAAKEKMDPIAEALVKYSNTRKIAEAIQEMPEGPEKENAQQRYAQAIADYKAAKHVMYAHNVIDDAAISDFNSRYDKIKNDIAGLEERKTAFSEHYRRLKKLDYSLQLAQDPNYIYGPSYPGVGFVFGKEKRTDLKEKKLWDRIEDAEQQNNSEFTYEPMSVQVDRPALDDESLRKE